MSWLSILAEHGGTEVNSCDSGNMEGFNTVVQELGIFHLQFLRIVVIFIIYKESTVEPDNK